MAFQLLYKKDGFLRIKEFNSIKVATQYRRRHNLQGKSYLKKDGPFVVFLKEGFYTEAELRLKVQELQNAVVWMITAGG